MRRHPDWLKVRIGGGENYSKVKTLLTISESSIRSAKRQNALTSLNVSAAAPQYFSYSATSVLETADYCNVTHGTPGPLNDDEPSDIAESVKTLGLKYVVVTSVTRDDLTDGGASVFYKTVRAIRRVNQDCHIEVLIPDFKGDEAAIQKVIDAAPDVINHNIEVVEDLFPLIRPQGNYLRSIEMLKTIKMNGKDIRVKSGLMVGLGESTEQILATLHDLRAAEVDFLTLGQYLQPTRNHAIVKKYYPPEEFLQLRTAALQLGFAHVESGPLVRSSYHAQNALQ